MRMSVACPSITTDSTPGSSLGLGEQELPSAFSPGYRRLSFICRLSVSLGHFVLVGHEPKPGVSKLVHAHLEVGEHVRSIEWLWLGEGGGIEHIEPVALVSHLYSHRSFLSVAVL